MVRKSVDVEQLSVLRDELFARNEIERLRQRGETPPNLLTIRLREPSLEVLLAKLTVLTSIPDGEDRIQLLAAIPEIQDAGDSVALICSKLDLVEPAALHANWRLNGKQFLCSKQNFDGEPGLDSRINTPATGFLVGVSGRHMLTAKHVAVDDNGKLKPELYCVFGYYMKNNAAVQSFTTSEVFRVSSLVARGSGIDEDWALVELEASSGRAGLPLRTIGTPAVLDSVVAIGYPHGLPAKTGTGTIRDVGKLLYEADLDIGAGNSGSPVIAVDGSGKPLYVEGIIVRGLYDLEFVEKKGCSVWVNACFTTGRDCWAGFVPIAKVMANQVFKATMNP